MTIAPTSRADSQVATTPSSIISNSATLAAIMMGTSWRISWRWTTKGVITADAPRMSNTLRMLLPTTLPMAMSTLPSSTAPADTANSGALVPNATTVSPTTNGEMPNDKASLAAPRTNQPAPSTRATKPPMNINTMVSDMTF